MLDNLPCRRRRLRGPLRQLPPSVGELPPNPAPSQFQQPKGGGSLVSTHAALSPELGSSLKARSGRKSGTTAPGVQGAGRGPLATSLVTFLFAQERYPLSGRDPTTPPAGCRKIPGGVPPPPGGANPPGCRKTPKEKTFQLPAHRRPPENTKLGPPLAPAGPPPHRGGRLPPRQVELGGALGLSLIHIWGGFCNLGAAALFF